MTQNTRESARLQCGNTEIIRFTLINLQDNTETKVCVCSDLSAVGAHFFADLEFQPGQKLMLSILARDSVIRSVPVTVVRADTELYDEERFCAAVAFDQPLEICEELKQLQSVTEALIAA